jgi:hypothetical protein
VNGRWHGVDPLAEKYLSYSPYHYCYNNPLSYIDPNGATIDPVDEKSAKKTKQQIDETFSQYAIMGNDGKEYSLGANFSLNKGKTSFKSSGWKKISSDLKKIGEKYNLSKEQMTDLTGLARGYHTAISLTDFSIKVEWGNFNDFGVYRIAWADNAVLVKLDENFQATDIYKNSFGIHFLNKSITTNEMFNHEIIGEGLGSRYYINEHIYKENQGAPILGSDLEPIQVQNLYLRTKFGTNASWRTGTNHGGGTFGYNKAKATAFPVFLMQNYKWN